MKKKQSAGWTSRKRRFIDSQATRALVFVPQCGTRYHMTLEIELRLWPYSYPGLSVTALPPALGKGDFAPP